MYERDVTSVKIILGDTDEFPLTIGLDQGLALSPYLFTLVLDELTNTIQDEVLWCMLFVDDIVVVEEIRERINQKFELQKSTLECKGFRISNRMIEYMHWRFSQHEKKEDKVRLDRIVVPKCNQFRYLGSLLSREWIDRWRCDS